MENEKSCGYTNEEGIEINECEDMPVTYCSKCESFYVLDKEGNKTEILIKVKKGIVG